MEQASIFLWRFLKMYSWQWKRRGLYRNTDIWTEHYRLAFAGDYKGQKMNRLFDE